MHFTVHFSTGRIAYFFNIKLYRWIILHTIFEIIENTRAGGRFITTYLTFWPGGKREPDNLKNSIGDLIFAIIGYIVAYNLDKYYRKKINKN